MSRSGFEAEVMTKLEYIQKEQQRQGKYIEKLFDKTESQVRICDKRFDNINSRLDKTEGYAKGAMAVGGIGGLGGIITFISRFFGLR